MKREPCGGCGGGDRWLLHNVCLRGTYRRLCTNCVLKNHRGFFCPICLDVFDESPPPHLRVMCVKCPSISHPSCAPSSFSSSSFLCPPCSRPNFSFFSPVNSPGSHNHDQNDHFQVLGKNSAKALVAAAKIAAVSMTKAAALARVEADNRVKEAALAKKRAKEALELLADLVHNHNNNNSSLLVPAKN